MSVHPGLFIALVVILVAVGHVVEHVRARTRLRREADAVAHAACTLTLDQQCNTCMACRPMLVKDAQAHKDVIRRDYLAALNHLHKLWTPPDGSSVSPTCRRVRWVQTPSPVGGVGFPDEPAPLAVHPGRKFVHLGRIGML